MKQLNHKRNILNIFLIIWVSIFFISLIHFNHIFSFNKLYTFWISLLISLTYLIIIFKSWTIERFKKINYQTFKKDCYFIFALTNIIIFFILFIVWLILSLYNSKDALIKVFWTLAWLLMFVVGSCWCLFISYIMKEIIEKYEKTINILIKEQNHVNIKISKISLFLSVISLILFILFHIFNYV